MTMNKDDEEVELENLDHVIPSLEEHGIGEFCCLSLIICLMEDVASHFLHSQ